MTNRSGTSRKRRDHLDIIAEMLEVARDGALKTKIMYEANLSFAQLNEYLSFLLEIGLERLKRIYEKAGLRVLN